MQWFKISANTWTQPEFIALSASAKALFFTASCWIAQNNTCGDIDARFLKYFGVPRPNKSAQELVDAGLWEVADCGYRFPGWSDLNPSKAEMEEERAANRDRVQKHREKTASNTVVNTEEVPSKSQVNAEEVPSKSVVNTEEIASKSVVNTEEVTSKSQVNAEEVQSIDSKNGLNTSKSRQCNAPLYKNRIDKNIYTPLYNLPPGTASPPAQPLALLAEPHPEPDPDQAFEEFWAAYPRHSAKKAARQKFQAALKTGTDPAVIIAGACRYRDDPNREMAYTAMPATWLNQERWLDDPLPPREPTNRPHQAGQTRLLTRSQQAAAAAMQAALAERAQQHNPQDLKQITAQEVPF